MRRLACIAAMWFCWVSVGLAQSIVQTIQLPNLPYWNQAWALTADGGYLYLGSATTDAVDGRKIMKLDFNGNVVDSIIMPEGVVGCQGFSFSGTGEMFFVKRYTNSSTILRFTTAGLFIDSIRTNQLIGGCKAFIDVAYQFWYSVYEPDSSASICMRSFPSGIQWVTFRTPTLQPFGVATDGAYLYYVENGSQGNRRGMYKLNQLSGDSVGFIPEPFDTSSNGTNPIGLAYDGRYMWMLAEPIGADSGRALYKYDLQSSGVPSINLVPAQMNFGEVPLGQRKTQLLEVRNQGTAPLHILDITFFIGEFSTDSTRPFTVQPQSSIEIPITFAPYQLGYDYGEFYFLTDDPNHLQVAWFATGYGVQPVSVESTTGIPDKFDVRQNYPNPFNPTTTIEIRLPQQSDVAVSIYDVLGVLVRSFTYESVPAGVHQIVWDGRSQTGTAVASGVYYYRARTGNSVQTKSMILIR